MFRRNLKLGVSKLDVLCWNWKGVVFKLEESCFGIRSELCRN